MARAAIDASANVMRRTVFILEPPSVASGEQLYGCPCSSRSRVRLRYRPGAPRRRDEAPRGERLLYVALTHTTRYLTVVHSGTALPLPAGRVEEPQDRQRRVERTIDLVGHHFSEREADDADVLPTAVSLGCHLQRSKVPDGAGPTSHLARVTVLLTAQTSGDIG
jgi:hypothetical protein